MLRRNLELLLFAGVITVCTAAPAVASPVLYASSDPETSSGTELYVIDPIAATITVLRGVGIGASSTGGFGDFSGGYVASTPTGGGASLGGGAISGGSTGTSGGTLAATSTTAPSSEPTSFSDFPQVDSPQPLKTAIVFSPEPQPLLSDEILGPTLGNPGGPPGPGPGCTVNCDTPPITNCTENCSNDVPFTPAALQIAQVPEPGSIALLGLALAGLGLMRRRKSS